MQRLPITVALFSLTLLFVCSCTSFRATDFPGQPVELDADEVSEDTVWTLDDQVYHVRRIDDSARFVVSMVEWDDETGSHRLSSQQVVLSELGDTRFLSIKDGDHYVILRLLVGADGRTMMLATLDSEALEERIESGTLDATEDEDGILFEGTKEELDTFLSAEADPPFDLDALGVLRLISGEIR